MPEQYVPPSGPPPGYRETSQQYNPPPGPPPGWREKGYHDESFAPPPGPPPSRRGEQTDEEEPPPYDPWMSVPDNALLPPPPSIREERSPGANATRDDAIAGHDWCDHNPLWRPRQQNQQTLLRISQGDVNLTSSPTAKNVTLQHLGPGRTHVRTGPRCTDVVFLSDIPLYTASMGQPRTVYFELQVIAMGSTKHADEEAGIAVGFLAPPYPAWRLPGWHRGSLGVHGDDGRRYVDNSYGGTDFTQSFRNGDVVGIGMIFRPATAPGRPNDCEVFFTRNGKSDGQWRLHEEKDQEQEDGNVVGLEGAHDLLAAVGVFGPVEFEAKFQRATWLFKP